MHVGLVKYLFLSSYPAKSNNCVRQVSRQILFSLALAYQVVEELNMQETTASQLFSSQSLNHRRRAYQPMN